MKFIEVQPERLSLRWRQFGPPERGLVDTGYQQRAEQVGRFRPDDATAQADQQNPATTDQRGNVQALRLAERQPQSRTGRELAQLVEYRPDHLHPFGFRDV